MMQLPGESGQEFVLQRPFVPISKANQLSSFMVARNDGDNYGKLIVYQAPDQSDAVSPARAASLIEADPTISRNFSLLDQRGSNVLRGDTQLIPIDGAIFYVRPIYVEGSGNSPLPRYNYVAVTYGEKAVLDDKGVLDAVQHLLNNTTPTSRAAGLHQQRRRADDHDHHDAEHLAEHSPSTTPVTVPTNATVAQLLAQANQLFDEANQALANQDLATFDEKYKQAVALVAEANRLASQTTTPTTTPSATTLPSSSTTRPKSGGTATTVAHA